MVRPESAEQALLRQEFGAQSTLIGAGATAAAPAAGTVIAKVANPGAGRYKVRAVAYQRGAIDTAHYANANLQHGATVVGAVLTTDLPTPAEDVVMDVLAGEDIQLVVIALGAAGSVFAGQLQADLLD